MRIDNQATQAEARKQREVALQAYMDDQRRLMRVSYPLLTKGSDRCGDDIRYTTGLALANSSTLLGEDFRESAQNTYQLTDEVKAVYVIPGSAADKAGIRSGDTIRYIGDWSLPAGQNAVRQSLEQLQLQTQTGKAVRLDVVRNGKGQSLLITPDKSCAYPVVLGDGDEVN
ncbi:MAG: PDZ domain-containing protein, partial [Fluviibacter sp.]